MVVDDCDCHFLRAITSVPVARRHVTLGITHTWTKSRVREQACTRNLSNGATAKLDLRIRVIDKQVLHHKITGPLDAGR